MAIKISNNTVIDDSQNFISSGTGYVKLPAGTDAQRPGTPVPGMFRYNTTSGKFEGYTTSWGEIGGGGVISNDITTNANRFILWDDISSGPATTMGVSATRLYFNPSTGILFATQFSSLSDKNHKDNIEPITDATYVVKQLEGVSFNWKDGGAKSYGVVAQELEKVLPELVTQGDPKTVNYDGIIAFLINAVKELDARVRQLEG